MVGGLSEEANLEHITGFTSHKDHCGCYTLLCKLILY